MPGGLQTIALGAVKGIPAQQLRRLYPMISLENLFSLVMDRDKKHAINQESGAIVIDAVGVTNGDLKARKNQRKILSRKSISSNQSIYRTRTRKSPNANI